MQESMQISLQKIQLKLPTQTPLYSHYLDHEREGFKKKNLISENHTREM